MIVTEDDVIVIGIIIAYFALGYFICRLVDKLTSRLNKYLQFLILSVFYTLFFGIGISGSGGNPGFAFPSPILVAIILGLWKWIPTNLFVNGVIIPFFIWWSGIFVFWLIITWWKSVRTPNLEAGGDN